RLPDSTAAQTRSLFVIVSLNSCTRSPALPMHVVQPYAATPKPSFSRYGSRPDFARYSVTTREPGASEVLTCGLTVRPLSTAFFRRGRAASRPPGFEVFVHDVIAAMSTPPEPMATVFGAGGAMGSGVSRLSTISSTLRGAAPTSVWVCGL